MDELIEIMRDIRFTLNGMSMSLTSIESGISDLQESIESIKGYGADNTIADLSEKIDDAANSIQGYSVNNTLSDLHTKLEEIDSSLSSIDTSITCM